MHRYSDDQDRVAIYSLLAIGSVVVAWLIVLVTSHLDWPPWLVSAPSMAGVYVGLYALFDRVLWRMWICRAAHLSNTPDVNGTYRGTLTSTYKDDQGQRIKLPIEIEICQTWTRMELRMTIGDQDRSSTSRSTTATVTGDSKCTRLNYYYRNQINPGVADSDMGDHDGAAELEITNDGTVTGRYFNSRPRSGSIDAQRVRQVP